MTDASDIAKTAGTGRAVEAVKLRSIGDLVDAAAEKNNVTYYRIAKILQVSPSHLVHIRKGITPLTEHHAEKLADLLGEPAGAVYAEAKAARAKRTDLRLFWARVAKGLQASALLVFVGLFAPAQDAQATARGGALHTTVYTLCARWRARWRALGAQFLRTRADILCYQ